jgi:hypothetical protein
VEVTLVPVGGPGAVTGVRGTRRTRGFTIAHHQATGHGPVHLLVVSLEGKPLRPGRAPIARLATAKGRWRVQAVTVAR